jgi:hypothetical protein
MIRLSRLSLVILLALVTSLGTLGAVQAARGAPGSPEFGIGAAYYPGGPYQKEALALAADLDPDWLYVPVSWSAFQPDASMPPRFEALDAVFKTAGDNQIAVVASIYDVPGWAQTAQGPDGVQAAQFVTVLTRRYPQVLQAVELFPRANTKAAGVVRPTHRRISICFARWMLDCARAVRPFCWSPPGLSRWHPTQARGIWMIWRF